MKWAVGFKEVVFCSLTLVLTSNGVSAETLICRGKVGSGVEHTGSNHLDANLYDVSQLQLTVTDLYGGWQVFENQDKKPIFTTCESQYKCVPEPGFFGVFYMTKENVFTYIIQKAYGPGLNRQMVYTVKGHCLLDR